jgi:hypothetical protein
VLTFERVNIPLVEHRGNHPSKCICDYESMRRGYTPPPNTRFFFYRRATPDRVPPS